jgi:uncharacterized protein YndB with AHSA1/START domain
MNSKTNKTESMKQTIYSPDAANKKMTVERSFNAPVSTVWKAWTEPEFLDQWWAPKPWKAITQSMDFREGGRWRYYMLGPEGEKHYCLCDYYKINPEQSYTGHDAFCDEAGTINKEMPGMDWHVEFTSKGNQTDVLVTIKFASEEAMKAIVEMGFKEGFSMAHENLDELLKNLVQA